jgi:hypothetical protein
MKVLCIANNILCLDNNNTINRLKKYINLSDGQLNLELNSEYVVYGILFRDNCPWFYLCLDEDDESPTPYPAELFKILDDTIPSCWKLFYKNIDGKIKTEIVFLEWANEPNFYERLVDSDPVAVKTFKKYRQLLDQ